VTGANRFTFDIIANDKASDATSKVTTNVQALTAALNAGAEAYERLSVAQRKVGVPSNSGQIASIRQLSQAQSQQARSERDAEQAAKRRAAQENADAQRRASLVASSAAKEQAAIRAIESALEKSVATYARVSAAAQSGSAARIAALNAEIGRTQQLVAVKLQEVQAAQRVAQVAQRAVATGTGSTGVGAGDSRASAAAVQALANAHRGLTAAQQANTSAASALAAEQRRVDAANRSLSESTRVSETQLNTVRYALYQVAAAYTAMGRVAIGAGADVAKTAIDFQSAFAQVTRTTGLGEEVRQGVAGASESVAILRDEFVALSTQIPKSFGDLAAIGALGAQLGIAKADILDFTSVVAKFSATTNVSTEQAAQEFGRLGNLLDVPSSKFENLASSVSYLGTTSVATESEILAVAAQIGAVGTNAGLSAPYVVGLSTAMASLRIAPELARGATTRIFSNITRAVADGGDALNAYANVLGTTSEKAGALFEQNPEKFFSDLVTGLGQANDNGQNLTLILDSLGIKASRDVQVIQRLAGSYQLLGDYTGKAFESFTKGTYLDTSFQDIAVTTQAALTEMVNSFSAFKDSVGQAFLGPIKIAADALNGLFTVLSKLPAAITGPFAGILIAVGVLAAFRAAMALAGAAILAFRTASAQLTGGAITLRSVLQLLNQAQTQVAGSTSAAAVAARAQTVAFGGSSATILGAAGATTALAETQVVATGTSLGLAAGFRTVMAAIGPVGWTFLAIGALVGLLGGLSSDSNDAAKAAQELRQEQDALNQSWLSAGNGADALQKAIRSDTTAYQEAQAAGQGVGDAYKVITQGTQTMADGSKKAVASIQDLRTGVDSVIPVTNQAVDGFGGYVQAMANATDQAVPTAAGIDSVTASVQGNTVALGNSTKEWEKAALFDKLSTLFSGNEMQTALKQLEAFQPGILKDAIKAALEGGPEEVANSFKGTTDAISAEMIKLQAVIDADAVQRNAATGGKGFLVPLSADAAAATTKIKELQAQYSLLAQLQQQFKDASSAIDAASTQTQIDDALSGALGIISDEMDTTTEAAKTLEEQIQGTRDAYGGLVEDIFAVNNAQGELVSSFEALGASIGEHGTDFSNFTEGGRANLAALQDAVTAFAATQDYAIANQGLSAQEAAANTAAFIQDTLAELSNQGVDTSQLDFLNNYLMQLTGNTYQVAVGADVSAAIANLNFLQGALNSIAGSINGVLGTIARFSGKAAGKVSFANPSAQARTPVAKSALSGALNSGRQAAAAKEADKLAKANDGAGGAAKKAGKAQKDAADKAAEALKKQQEYVKDLANFYENLASKAFQSVNNEGKAFASLQKLGQALVENGKAFNTVTDNGRKNFDALSSVFDSFGATLSDQIERGTLSADGAAAKYREFARGVYGELTSLGVPTQQLTGFFRALGVDATGWTGNTGDVQQYAGYISAAAEAVANLSKKLDLAEEYAKALGEALDKAFNREFGLDQAADTVISAMNKIRDAYQEGIDKVKQLRDENQGLSADLATAQADKRKAEIEQAISLKYGETDRANDYGAQAGKAQSTIDDTVGKISTNSKDIATIEAGRGALLGNTDAAIANRGALVDLQKQMLSQIEAYAATGATTEQVTAYTESLRAKFVDVATQAGYTSTDISRYTGVFQTYIATIKTVPDRITTTATADTSAATAALNAIPKSGTYSTVATLDGPNYDYVKWRLSQIPTKGDYVVNVTSSGAANISPQVDGGALGGAQAELNRLTAPRTVKISPEVPQGLIPGFSLYRSAVANLGGLIANKKVIGGFSGGGHVPGKSPRDPRVDNLLAQGPGGLFGIRSGEFVMREPMVKKYGVSFFEALNNGNLPGFARGGYTGQSAAGTAGSMVVELSPDDRALIRGSRSGGTTLMLDGLVLAKSTDKKNAALARKGTG
jgi:TP901 family phage tail tape measure protein